MIVRLRRGTPLGVALAAMALLPAALCGKEPQDSTRAFWADARVYSVMPGEELASYRSHSGGGVGPNGTLGFGVRNQQRHFEVSIVASQKGQRFLAEVTVKPEDGDALTRELKKELDLTNLEPQQFEVARDEGGRVFRLMLVPRIVVSAQPQAFEVARLKLQDWSFPSSPIIVNDQDYVGRLAMSSGSVAWCDIPGLAKFEFSLLPLKDAAVLGTLHKGVLEITHDSGTTVRISDVKNGVSEETLGGGPYQVWVRWQKPTQSTDEYRRELAEQVARLKRRIAEGGFSMDPRALERLEKMRASGRVGLISSGLREPEEGEIVETPKP